MATHEIKEKVILPSLLKFEMCFTLFKSLLMWKIINYLSCVILIKLTAALEYVTTRAFSISSFTSFELLPSIFSY